MQINLQFQHYMDAAVIAEDANKGFLQIVDEENGELVCVAKRGFSKEFVKQFGLVKAFGPTTCGRALGTKNMVIINNIEQDKGFRPYLQMVKQAGIMSVKSTPILNSEQKCIGVISVHYMDANTAKNANTLGRILPCLVELIEGVKASQVRANAPIFPTQLFCSSLR